MGPYYPGCDLGRIGAKALPPLPLRLGTHDRRYGPGPSIPTSSAFPEDLTTAYQRGVTDERSRLRALPPTAWIHKTGMWLSLRPPRNAAELNQWQALIPTP